MGENAMPQRQYHKRLEKAVQAHMEQTGEKLSAVSLAAGKSHSYLSNLFKKPIDKRDSPRIDTFLKICEKIGASPAAILLGWKITRAQEESVSLVLNYHPGALEDIAEMARQHRSQRR